MIHIEYMERLHIDGQSIKFVDRKLCKRESSADGSFLTPKLYTLHSTSHHDGEEVGESGSNAIKSDVQRIKSSSGEERKKKKYSDVLVDNKVKKRKILKRPKRFKNYYTDRMPLTIPSFSFPRLGEQFSFRGRQTICKYYDNNELINNQLIRIKSATTATEIERIFNEQFRNKQGFLKSEKYIEPYFDTQTILQEPSASETCLCAKEFYRLDYNLHQVRHSAIVHRSLITESSNAIKRLDIDNNNSSFDAFLQSANECYDTCIQYYLNNLNACNKRAESIAARQSHKRPASTTFQFTTKEENSLTNQLRKLNINLEKSTRVENFERQSSTSNKTFCSFQAMSCNDTNNNTESTNFQLKDPPKIICSDFSSNHHQANTQGSGGDSEKDFSDNCGTDKNCLTIPHSNYSSEARPP